MPVSIRKIKGSNKVRVSTPGGVKAKATSMANAKRQRNILNAVEYSDWRPTGKPARDAMARRVMGK